MRAAACALVAAVAAGCATRGPVEFVDDAMPFAPGVIASEYSDVRLTISPDGRRALWFSRNRPGGAGGYDIWMSDRTNGTWSAPVAAPFNSASRDFDPAFTADGRYVYFSSDRPGGSGGDDIYRVRLSTAGFGAVEHLAGEINGPRNEWAPMLSPDGHTLLFSSDRPASAGGMDLFVASRRGAAFAPARPVRGALNTTEDEFDATFLADGVTIVFSRARDLRKEAVHLELATHSADGYSHGTPLPDGINTPGSDTYAPMLDWSRRDRLTFTTRRPADNAGGVDVYLVSYRTPWKR